MQVPDLRGLLARAADRRAEIPEEWRARLRVHLLERLQAAVRTAAGVIAAVMLVSVAFRHTLMTGALAVTTGANLALVLVVVVVAWLARHDPDLSRARPLAAALVLAAVLECGAVIHLGGGLDSMAWPSLLLVIMGVPLLFPLSTGEMLGVAALVWAVLLGLAGADGASTMVLVDRTLWLVLGTLVGLAANHVTSRLIRDDFFSRQALREEQERTEQLLLNVLPLSIAERLKHGEESIAEAFEGVTVLFADIVGFTPLSSGRGPAEVVGLLDDLFSRFDALALEHDLEKIKTIGDCYMVAGGIPLPQADNAAAVAEMALGMLETLERFDAEHGVELAIRIGLHSGPVVAGVIGRSKFVYDLWGDTVNTASRMESHGIPGRIQVTSEVRRCLEDRYRFSPRGVLEVKGKGRLEAFLLDGRRDQPPPPATALAAPPAPGAA